MAASILVLTGTTQEQRIPKDFAHAHSVGKKETIAFLVRKMGGTGRCQQGFRAQWGTGRRRTGKDVGAVSRQDQRGTTKSGKRETWAVSCRCRGGEDEEGMARDPLQQALSLDRRCGRGLQGKKRSRWSLPSTHAPRHDDLKRGF